MRANILTAIVVAAFVAAPSAYGDVLPEVVIDVQSVAPAVQPPPPPPAPPAPPAPRARTKIRDWARDHAEWRTEERESFGKVVKAGQGSTLVLSNLSGNISVTADAGSDIRIEATKRGRGTDSADARKQLGLTDIEVTDRAGRVTVTTIYRTSPNRVAVDYTVVVPTSLPVEVKSLSGNVIVTGVKGVVRAETVSGNVTASLLAQDSWLKTVSGDVVVSASAVPGEISLNSVSGNIRTLDLKVRSLSAGTISGNIEMATASCDRASARSISGDVAVLGAITKGARYDVKSHSGDIRFAIDGKTGFEVSATSYNGTLKSDLPLTSRGSAEADEHGRHRVLQGVFGDGSAQFDVQVFSGNVTIVKK